jgi:hypothetical protein
LPHTLVQAQQSQAGHRGTRDEQRCEVNRIQCPDRVAGKRLPRPIDYLAGNPKHMPLRNSRQEVRLAIGSVGLRQFLQRDGPQQ